MAQIHSHPVLSQQEKRAAPKPPLTFATPANLADKVLLTAPLKSSPDPDAPVSLADKVLLLTPPERFSPTSSVTVVVVNFKTEELLRRCLKSFTSHYPDLRILLVDNGSGDGSTELVRKMGDRYEMVIPIFLESNIGHGPAMDQAIRVAETRYVFTMDTDCETVKSGFLEEMLKLFRADGNLYALGWLRHVDWSTGVPAPDPEGFMPYVHPSAAMYDREKYLTLYPFVHEGAPATRNMREALEAGYSLQPFPIREYVAHLEAGTRRMYGGRWNPGTDESPSPWREGARYPI